MEKIFPLNHNHSIFLVQSVISITAIGVLSYLLIDRRDPSIFLPPLASIVAYWLPSPTTNVHKVPSNDQPNNLIQSPQTTITEGANTLINPLPDDSAIHPNINRV